MAQIASSTSVFTLGDWAGIGNAQHVARVIPDGEDSLVKRIREKRQTSADRQYLERVRQPTLRVATLSEVTRLRTLLESRYGVTLSSPEARRKIATYAVDEVVKQTHRSRDQIWKLTVGLAIQAIEALPDEVQREISPTDEWSEPDSPSQWAKRFGVSLSTFRRMREQKEIRVNPITTKRVRIHCDDVAKYVKTPRLN